MLLEANHLSLACSACTHVLYLHRIIACIILILRKLELFFCTWDMRINLAVAFLVFAQEVVHRTTEYDHSMYVNHNSLPFTAVRER